MRYSAEVISSEHTNAQDGGRVFGILFSFWAFLVVVFYFGVV